MNVTDFFHFKASLKADRIINSSSDKENILGIGLLGCEPLETFLILKNFLNFLRKCLQFFYICITLFFCNFFSCFCKLKSQNIGSNQLCAVSFCGSHRNFRAGKCIKYIICFPSNGRSNYIDNGKGTDSSGFAFTKCRKAVCCLSGLTDDDRKAVFVQNWITITEL